MIELENISKAYGNTLAVNRLNLSVLKGEIFGFIGPNGAGKTTTINMIGGILSPTSGTVRICGIDMKTEPEKSKSKIGFIPDRPYLYEKLTGMEFLKFTADLYGVAPDSFLKKAREKLEMFSLMDWSNDLIEAYSHGMKQRLIMAAALLHAPEVIVVDEPMVGLDPAGIKMVKDLFRRLAGSGVTIFMSTHTLTVAEDVCDRIGIIHKGSLVATGTAAELKRKARAEDADLEQVFMRLTREAPDGQIGQQGFKG
jgi:ABC-2 type transport system ATP-binding protein